MFISYLMLIVYIIVFESSEMIGEGRIDWNDSVGEFIIVKIKRPEVLAELIRREK